jgi:hypothetical protein
MFFFVVFEQAVQAVQAMQAAQAVQAVQAMQVVFWLPYFSSFYIFIC